MPLQPFFTAFRSRAKPLASPCLRARAWPAFGLVVAGLACSTPPAEPVGQDGGPLDDASTDASLVDRALLIDHQSWQRYERSLDPLIAEQPPELACGVAGFFVERGELEIDSRRCNYLLAEHPALRDVQPGQRISLEFRHFDLEAPEPAQTHVAILFGDQLQWEIEIPIPSPANVIRAEFVATTELLAGEPIRLHLHNHGQNTYTFAWMRVAE
jgi:hypothetical protein